MAIRLSFVLFAVFLSSALGAAPFSDFVLHENRTIPDGFTRLDQAPGDQTIELRLAMVNSNLTGLENVFYAVSTPGNPSYGKHLSQEEVDEYVKPTDNTTSTVQAFLESHGVEAQSLSTAGDWLAVSVPVSKANEMFNTTFWTFRHDESGEQGIRVLSYSIPKEVQGHLEVVHPTVSFDFVFRSLPATPVQEQSGSAAVELSKRANVPAVCAQRIVPNCVRDFYNIPAGPATQSTNRLVVTGFLDQYANNADLSNFLNLTRQDIPPNTTFDVVQRNGGTNSQNSSQAGTEANLDIQYTVGVANGVPVTFLTEGYTKSLSSGLLDVVNYVKTAAQRPNVVTTSYGVDEQNTGGTLERRVCNDFLQVGAMGTSMIFASGDGGVAGSNASTSCYYFQATFPSGCPYVTSVGATMGLSETSAELSAGGFSTLFDRTNAGYQANDVTAYLASIAGSSVASLIDQNGRAYPDVSAQGINYAIVKDNLVYFTNGTSASAPVFASVIALVNDRLIAAGRNPLGFLNPFLYGQGRSAFNDITTGNNPGCGTNGFSAGPGWDPVTGLGTPDFERLLVAAGI